MIIVDPSDANRNTIYIGGSLTSAKTTNGGSTWTLMSMWLRNYGSLPYIHADFHDGTIVTTPSGGSALVVGTDGGLSISYDKGVSWDGEYLNRGLTTHLIEDITGSPRYPSAILIGLQDLGTMLSSDGSSDFNEVFGGDGDGCGTSQANDVLTIVSYYNNNFECIYGSIVDTYTLNAYSCNNGISSTDTTFFFTNLVTPSAAADPSGTVFFTATAQSIYQSSLNGGSLYWNKIGTNGYNGLSSDLFRETFHMMAVGTTSVSRVAACKTLSSGYAALAITVNGGSSWTEITYPNWIRCSAPLWTTSDGMTLYVASMTPYSGYPRLLKSTDAGSSSKWTC